MHSFIRSSFIRWFTHSLIDSLTKVKPSQCTCCLCFSFVDVAGEKALAVVSSKSSSVSLYKVADGEKAKVP